MPTGTWTTSQPPRAGDVLTQRALHRATLARQGLLARWTLPAAAAVARLVGVEAQAPHS